MYLGSERRRTLQGGVADAIREFGTGFIAKPPCFVPYLSNNSCRIRISTNIPIMVLSPVVYEVVGKNHARNSRKIGAALGYSRLQGLMQRGL